MPSRYDLNRHGKNYLIHFTVEDSYRRPRLNIIFGNGSIEGRMVSDRREYWDR